MGPSGNQEKQQSEYHCEKDSVPTEMDISNRRNKANEYHSSLNRLPTFGEVLARKTQSPVDLGSFYIFMDQHEEAIDYLDFWLEVMHHLTLCKHYVKGLRESIIRNSVANQQQQQQRQSTGGSMKFSSPQLAGYRNSQGSSSHRQSLPFSEVSKHKSLSSSILLDLIMNDRNMLEETDSHRLSQFLRGELSLDYSDPKVKELLEEFKKEHYVDAPTTPTSQFGQFPNTSQSNLHAAEPELGAILDQYPNRRIPSSGLLDFENNDTGYLGASTVRPVASTEDFAESIAEQVGRAKVASMSSNPKYVSYNSAVNSNNTGDSLLNNQESQEPSQPSQPSQAQDQRVTSQNSEQSPSNLYNNKINPSFLEKLIKEAKLTPDGEEISSNSFVTREHLRESSHNLLLKYFVEDAEKKISIPKELNEFIVNAIERDGRDDPDVFSGVRSYVFKLMESESFPKFLYTVAIHNITEFGSKVRMIFGLILLFFAFWIAFILLFLNYEKHIRAVVVVPFLIAFYLIVTSIYYIDPILVALGFSESFDRNRYLIKIKEKFVRRFLIKRSLWVLFLIVLLTAAMALIFSLVPGHRL